MNLTEEQLKEVETLAGLFFRPEDIIRILGIPHHQLSDFEDMILLNPKSPIYQFYHRGRLKALVELRQAIRQAALNGSNPALTEMMEYFNKSKI